jgi:uncharacterized protein
MESRIFADGIYAPAFTVELENSGKKIPKDEIIGIEIDEELENPGMFRISFNESLYPSPGSDGHKFKWMDNDIIAPGTKLLIHFGYGSLGSREIFRGRIKGISPGFPSSGTPTLSVNGFDLSHDLQKTLTLVKSNKVTYQDVAMEIAQKNLRNKLHFSGGEPVKLIVYEKIERDVNKKDYDFLKDLAKKIGFEFFVRNQTLYFRSPEDNKTPELSFDLYSNIISFSPRMSVTNVVNEVRVTACNEKEKTRISETARISELKSSIGIQDFEQIVEKAHETEVKVKVEGRVVRTREEAKALALSELKRLNGSFITGTLECAGNPVLRPGKTVNIGKVGTRFSGPYYITKATHTFGDNGYRTTIELRRCL